jgi:hypothetical protein
MQKLAIGALALSLVAGAATAQTTSPPTNPSPTTPPPVSQPTTPQAMPSDTKNGINLTEEQARQWVGKTVYSSDAKNVGEIEAVQRNPAGRVTEVHADIGGFLGLGETRVRVMADQFKVEGDRIVLNMTADQAKTLPKVAK